MRYSRYMEDEPAVDIWQFNSQIWNVTGDRPTPDVHQTATLMNRLRTPGGFITEAWPYLFATAGLILFALLVWGALEIQFGAATPKSAESGKQRITNAVIGFVLLFSVFWMGQLIQQIFGLNFAVGQEVSIPGGQTGGGSGGGTNPPPVQTDPPPLGSALLMNPNGTLQVCAGGSDERIRTLPVSMDQRLIRNGATVSSANFPVEGVFPQGSQILRCSIFDVGQTAEDIVQNDFIAQLQAQGVPGLVTTSFVAAEGKTGVVSVSLSTTQSLSDDQIRQILAAIESFPEYEFSYQFQTEFGSLPVNTVELRIVF